MTNNPSHKNNVTITGKADAAQTLVFGHGFGTDQTAWHEVAKAFEKDYRIVLYDNVGGGKSDPEAFSPNLYDSLDAYANDLIDICGHLQLRNAIMIAHSVSGVVSLLASLKAPHLFSKIVLVGASPRYRNDDGYVGGFSQSDLDGLYDTMDNNYFAWVSGFSQLTMGNPERPELAASFAQSLSAIRPDIAQSVARTIFQSDYRDVLKKIKVPVLILSARNDVAVPLDVPQYMHEQIPDSEVRILNATGHFPHISAPQEVIEAIKQFI